MSEPSSGMRLLERGLAVAMSLCLSLAAAVLVLTPIHASQTLPVPLTAVDGDLRFELPVPDGYLVAPGHEFPLYRYHEQFKSELGRVVVEKVDGGSLAARIRKEGLVHAAGRHGRIVEHARPGVVGLDLGSVRLSAGSILNVFRDHRLLGRVRLLEASVPGQPVPAVVIRGTKALGPLARKPGALVGLAVSEYTVETTVILFSNQPWLLGLEWGLFGLVLIVEVWLAATGRYGLVPQLLGAVAWAFRRLPKRRGDALLSLLAAAASIALLWYVSRFLVFIPLTARLVSGVKPYLPAFWTQHADQLARGLFVLLVVAYVTVLIRQGRHLPMVLWDALEYRPRWLERVVTKDATTQRFLVWLLHLPVVWAFALALLGFVGADVNKALEIMAPEGVELTVRGMDLLHPLTIPRWLSATASNIGKLSVSGVGDLSFDQWMNVARLLIWALTILGCLLGYVHSVLAIGPWSKLRNVDFTLMGWVANSLSYPALLGATLWTSVPYPFGPVPIMAQGPAFFAMLLLEMAFNLLYMGSVWNMGTKFGVMVDKGVVRRGFYAVVRHPSYFMEAVMLSMIGLKTMTGFWPLVGTCFNFFNYWLRSERDEQFMEASNPDYADYKAEVPFKYVRGLY